MNNVELLIFKNSEFITGSYNGIVIIIRQCDGFINATKFCNQFNKKFNKIHENQSWRAYFNEFCLDIGVEPFSVQLVYELKKGVSFDFRGTYVDPRLINYIAIWASPRYAVYVGKIMDLINAHN